MKCRLRVAANELDSSFRFNYVGKKKQIKWYDIKGAKRLESLHNFVSNQSFGNVLGWSERARIKLTWGVINLYQSISETAATTVSRDLSFYVKQKKKSIATTNGELQNFCTIFSATESGVIHNFCQFSALCRLTIFFIQSINFCRGERGNLWHFVWGISDRVWVLMISDDCWFITI